MSKINKTEVLKNIEEAINSIRPYLKADGGDVTLMEITDDLTVKVKLTGACDGCPFSFMTLKAGIEQAIRKKLPNLKELIAIS